MGQKINPISLRLNYTNRHFDNCWYSNYFYKNLITKDIFLQSYLNNFLKLLKLSSGRYSIQHFQKRTQIYNFLCYSKQTREWRLKLFGLTKKQNSLQKTRYFFKNKTEFKTKTRKLTKLNYYYNTLNQVAVYKIKKKISSFQNFQLWSTLIKPIKKTYLINSFYLNRFLSFPIENSQKLNKNLFLVPLKKSNIFHLMNQTIQDKPKDLAVNYTLKKVRKSNTNLLFIPLLNSDQKMTNAHLLFLQNLFIYKSLKSNLTNDKIVLNNKNLLSNIYSNFNALDFKYKNYLESCLSNFYNLETDLYPFKVKNDWQHANFLADEIVYFLEKRITFRRLKSKILRQLSKISAIRGVRITCSGRVGGKSKKAQRAKIECIKYGQTSLQVFSSKIDFSVKTAFTSFGSVGVKVWVCYN